MPAIDTAQPSDTTPPSPAGGGKTGKGGSASKASAAAAADQAAVATPDAAVEAAEDSAAEPPEPEPEPGWFRNTGAVELTVLPDQYPSAKLAPGEATWLPDDPRHPNLERCDAPTPDAPAADTAGSEK